MPVLFVNAAWTFVKRILHRSSAKDGNRFVLAGCEGSPENRKECENDRDEPADPGHAAPPKKVFHPHEDAFGPSECLGRITDRKRRPGWRGALTARQGL